MGLEIPAKSMSLDFIEERMTSCSPMKNPKAIIGKTIMVFLQSLFVYINQVIKIKASVFKHLEKKSKWYKRQKIETESFI